MNIFDGILYTETLSTLSSKYNIFVVHISFFFGMMGTRLYREAETIIVKNSKIIVIIRNKT